MCKLILLNGYWNDWGEFPVKNKQTNKQTNNSSHF